MFSVACVGCVEKPLVKEEETGKACLESADSGRIAPAVSRLSLLMEMLTLLLRRNTKCTTD